jgi:tRNA threonylcarbamoyladenosine biosynthesis protein TsaE
LPYYHLDLYRLDDEQEAETLGLDDYFYGDGVCVIEWADRVAGLLPSERLEIELHYLDETKRRIIMRAYGTDYEALLDEFKNSAFKH